MSCDRYISGLYSVTYSLITPVSHMKYAIKLLGFVPINTLGFEKYCVCVCS